jgi:phytoene dehydrogenase-like protein
MAAHSILIIGAGLGGLSTGCYARMNGYDVTIVEMHGAAGGVCASWERGGYVFDGCIHNLAGTSPASPFNRMWRELGAIPQRLTIGYPELVRVERPDGEPLVMHADLGRLRADLGRQFPHDIAAIDEMIDAARALTGVDLMGLTLASPLQRLKALAHLPVLARWGPVTLEQYARRFKDPFLREAFPSLIYDWPQQSMVMLLSFLASAHNGDFGWPVGGSGAFAHAIERRFLDLGGRLLRQTRVDQILVEHDKAVGVRLGDGSELRADIVVSNAYGPDTIFRMLAGKYADRTIRAHYARPQDRVEMGIHVAIGLARDLSHEPHAFVLPLDPPAVIAGEQRRRLYVQTFGFDASMGPPGKSVIKVLMGTSFDLWEGLYRTPELYRHEKQRILEQVIVLLEARFPGIRQQVEMSDVATPMTTFRYTGNGRGYAFSMPQMALGLFTGRIARRTLPGLANFYMVGQWAGLPGVPLAAAQGRQLVRAICRRDGRPFTARAPGAPRPAGHASEPALLPPWAA